MTDRRLPIALSLLLAAPLAQADSTPHVLADGDFFQDWSDAGLITASDNWSGVPSIVGFRGDGLAGSTAVDPQTILAADDPGVVDVNANQTNPNTFTTGGVTEFALANPTVALTGSGTARAPHLRIYLDTTGRENVTVFYTLRDLENGADNSVQPVALHYRIGASGGWTNVPAAFVADASAGPNVFGPDNSVSVVLPAEVADRPEVQLRIMTSDAAGSDEWIGIDDIEVVSTPIDGGGGGPVLSISSVALAEGNAGTTAFEFTLSLDAPMPPKTSCDFGVETFGGDATPGVDYQFLDQKVSIQSGEQQTTVTVLVNGDTDVEPDETFLLEPYGEPFECDIFQTSPGVGTIVNDDGLDIEVGIAAASVGEGDAGTVNLVLPVTLSSPAPAATAIPFTVTAGTATEGVDYQTTSGNVLLAMGATSGEAVVVVNGDLLDENDETLTVTLGQPPQGYVIATESATGTILDDDLPPTVSVSSPSVAEGNAGTTPMVFTVSLSAPSGLDVTFTRATADGTATAGSDYVALPAAAASIPAGGTTLEVAVQINGDSFIEASETFSLVLSGITNGTPTSVSGTGTIINDDFAGPPPALIPTDDPRALFLLMLVCASAGLVVLRRRG